MTLLIGIVLGAISLASIIIKRAYQSVPLKKLKKQARDGDQVALLLYRAVSYGSSLEIVLWVLVAVTTSAFFVYVSQHTDTWFAGLLTAVVIWYGFLWLPKRRASRLGLWIAAKSSPVISRLVSLLHPVLRRIVSFVSSYLPVHIHTGLYDKEDLVGLLKQQQAQADNQIPDSSLEIAIHALAFGDVYVRDVLVPRRAVKMVAASDTTGPVLMSELHDSGFSRFPVYEEEPDRIVGILHMRDLIKAKSASKVSSKMRSEVLYIHEEQTLEAALKAMLKTKQHQFIVVNSFEEFVGILTIEDVLESIIGQQIIDEFDQYDDMRAVATSLATKQHEAIPHAIDEE